MSNLAKLATAVQNACARKARDLRGETGASIADAIEAEDLTYLVAAHVVPVAQPPAGGVQDGYAQGLEAAAKWVESRRDLFINEHGYTDPATGTLEFGRGPHAEAKLEYVGELEEIAEGIRAMLATTPAHAEPKELTPLNEHTRFILGRPNFSMIGIANMLRQRGDQIAPKAEDEQAHAIHFLLNMYEQHGANWNEAACAELRRVDAAQKGGTA